MSKKIILPDYVIDFMNTIRASGHQIYLVGGAVRDILMERKTSNWDFATSATPEQILSLFPKAFYHNPFGTVSIPMTHDQQEQIFEVTPFRIDGNYQDHRHPDQVVWGSSLEEDVVRRDFTINAMATDGQDIVDMVGGAHDLKKGIIRCVGKPQDRFQEDALRMLRAVRQASQLCFTIEDETKRAIREHAPLLKEISSERVRDELLKILGSEYPAEGILLMRETRLLDVVLPEVMECFGVEQKSPGRHHVDDVGTHLVKSLRFCTDPDPVTRLATLLHDIGKAKTVAVDPATGTITFYNHEVVGARQAMEIAQRLCLSKKQQHKLVTLVRYHMFSVSESQTDKALRRFISHVGIEYLDAILALRHADRRGSGVPDTSWRTELFKKRLEEVQKQPFTIHDLAIKGPDIMAFFSLPPSPTVGKIMKHLFRLVDDEQVPNTKDDLMRVLKTLDSASFQ
ncbi:MAG: CCA-adding enzyme [Microgenomates bacterium OLB22]|nr:MAG: CCA-adding enzyme [Microgenomates bacterium OLB22]